jgi:hypothetical protein
LTNSEIPRKFALWADFSKSAPQNIFDGRELGNPTTSKILKFGLISSGFFLSYPKVKWTLFEPQKIIKKTRITLLHFPLKIQSHTKKTLTFSPRTFYSSHLKFDCLKKSSFCCFTEWSTERRIANLYEISYQYFFHWLEHWATHFAYFVGLFWTAANPAHVLIRSRYLFWPLDPQIVSNEKSVEFEERLCCWYRANRGWVWD